jgi:hypothetical protein
MPKNLEKSSIVKVKLRRAAPEAPEEKAILKNTAVETLNANLCRAPKALHYSDRIDKIVVFSQGSKSHLKII